MHAFYTRAPEIKYVQDDENTRVLSCHTSDLFSSNENVAEHAVVYRIPSS